MKANENACLELCGEIRLTVCVGSHLFIALGVKEIFSPRKKGKR